MTYSVQDPFGSQANAAVTIIVVDASGTGNHEPVASDDDVSTGISQTVTIEFLNNDWDPDAEPISVESYEQPALGLVVYQPSSISYTASSGTITIPPRFLYTPPAGFTGTESFDYTIQDRSGAEDTASVTVTVPGTPENISGTARQEYQIFVHPEPGNAPPVIISDPSLTHVVAGFAGTPEGAVTPQTIDLELGPNETITQAVSLEVGSTGGGSGSGAVPPAPPDALTVFNETDGQALLDALLFGNSGINVTSISVAGHTNSGFGWASTGVFVNNNGTYGLGEYGIVLSSGNAEFYSSGPNDFEDQTADYSIAATGPQELLLDPITGGGLDHYDVTQIDINFNLVSGVDSIGFNVVFGSEEFDEYVGSEYIDAFGLYINNQSITDENIATVNGLPINIDHPDMQFLGGTELDGILAPGGNAVVPFVKVLGDGAQNNTLTIIVADSGDEILDTTVFIENLSGFASTPIEVDLEPSPLNPNTTTNVLTPSQTGLLPGDVATFDVEFTGTGQGDAFELHFLDVTNGGLLGRIPVTINNDYFYLVEAVDPDNDPIQYLLVDAPSGATMDPDTALVQWDPPAPGLYDFLVRVEDGRGGFDEQPFTVFVTDSNVSNNPPTIEPIDDREGQVGRPLEVSRRGQRSRWRYTPLLSDDSPQRDVDRHRHRFDHLDTADRRRESDASGPGEGVRSPRRRGHRRLQRHGHRTGDLCQRPARDHLRPGDQRRGRSRLSLRRRGDRSGLERPGIPPDGWPPRARESTSRPATSSGHPVWIKSASTHSSSR